MKQHENRPFFIDGYQNGKMILNIPKNDDYGHGCNLGMAGAYDYIRAGHEAYKGLLSGGLLQHIALSFTDREEVLTACERGFIVGFFYQLENQLGASYFNAQTAAQIKHNGLNDMDASPLTFRGRENTEDAA
ncbi:hypothetical protein [Thiomicrorhabdus indica]|uniref:hypothetical protein n=1 Tax=Thiomicrorhabdus indica TaxID=2267253 RepID=UPI002AA6F6E3|nr:hypothetical protein [Thiomicrorhabdus indica]